MRLSRGLIWRAGLVLLVYMLSLAAFTLGVGASEREGLPDASLLVQLYYASGLFVLGGMDLGTPDGGPALARAGLWLAYFLAPVITTSAVAEGLLRLVQPEWLGRWALRDHVVIIGSGDLGRVYAQSVRAVDPHRRLLLVDVRVDPLAALGRLARVSVVRGDARQAEVRAALRLKRASAVVIVTGDDLTNLELGWDFAAQWPKLPVVAHVSELGLLRRAEALHHGPRLYVFNTHQIAAEHLVRHQLAPHFIATDGLDEVVVAGLGRFGQTILEFIERELPDQVAQVTVLDRTAGQRMRDFTEQVGWHDAIALATVDGDLNDALAWTRVGELLPGTTSSPVFVLGANDEATNLRAASMVRRRFPTARIFVRVARLTAFGAQLAVEDRVELLPIEAVLGAALTAQYLACQRDEPPTRAHYQGRPPG